MRLSINSMKSKLIFSVPPCMQQPRLSAPVTARCSKTRLSSIVANLLILSASLYNLLTAGCSITLEMKSERGQGSQINNFRWRISLCVDQRMVC